VTFRTTQSVDHPAQLTEEEVLKECKSRYERRQGPGGQHRNKRETAVVLLHVPTGIEAQAAERRSQHENLRVAVKRMRIRLALSVRSSSLTDKSPTELWKSRCRDSRIHCSIEHEDFATLLAEVLNVLETYGQSISDAAARLNVTPSQLIKFVKREPQALLLINQQRRERGLHSLE